MRPSITCAGLAGLLALAGCGGPEKADRNEAAGEKESAAAPGAAAVSLRPGQWEMTVETVKVEAPGMPKQVADMMAARQRMTTRSCITAEEAQEPNADLFRGKKDGNCSYEDFSVSGGRVKGRMTCQGGDTPGAVTLEMDGRYGGDSYDISQKMTTAMEGMSMKIEARVTGRRVGDCPAGGGQG